MSKPFRFKKILAAVELGSPAADCAHFGICSVDVLTPEQWEAFQPRHIRHVKVIISRTKDGLLRFKFPFQGMRADTLASFFPAEGFRVDSACTFPLGVTDALGLPMGIRTKPAVYSIGVREQSLVVKLLVMAAEQVLAEAA